MQVDKKNIQEILKTVKDTFFAVRRRGGLGRADPDGLAEELEMTNFLDVELEVACRILLRKELAEALGIESWVRAEEE